MKLTYLGRDIFNIIKEYIDNYDKLNYINKATKLLKLNDYILNKSYSINYLYDIKYYTYINSIIQDTYTQLSLHLYNIYKCNFKSKLNIKNLFVYNCKNFCLNSISKCKSLSMWNTYIHISNSDNIECETSVYIDNCHNLISLSQFKTVKFEINSCIKLTTIKNDTMSELIINNCNSLKEIYANNIQYLTLRNNIFLHKLLISTTKIIMLEIENCDLLLFNNINSFINLEYLTITAYNDIINITDINLPNLKNLHINSYNNIYKINCVNLTNLLIYNNNSLESLTNNSLKVLEMRSCDIKYIYCNNLEKLILSHCDKIKKINNENLLYLSINELDYIIDINCCKLKSINISNCILANLILNKVETIILENSFIEFLYVPNLKTININDITDDIFINYIIDIINNAGCINTVSMLNVCSILKPIKLDNLKSLSIINSEVLTTIHINKIENVYFVYINFTEYIYNFLKLATITNLYLTDLALSEDQLFKIINLHNIKNITIDNERIK